MGRKFKFYSPLRVRYVEVDAQGHVFYGHYLTYFDIALMDYMRVVGYDSAEMAALGVDMFYVEATCQYKGRAYFNDLLHVHTRIGTIGNTSLTFEFAVFKQLPASGDAPGEEQLIATGKSVAVVVDTSNEEPVRVPDELRQAVARFEESA